MATKERLAAMAASLCAVCSGSMVIKLVEADPSDGASELRSYVSAECGHSGTYSVAAGKKEWDEYLGSPEWAGGFSGHPAVNSGWTATWAGPPRHPAEASSW